MDTQIKEVLKYAVMAPSGDNSQPWKFKIKDNILDIFNLPEKDNQYLNVNQSGSLIAHGALLKNIEIAAPSLGLSVEIKYILEGDHIARVTFREAAKEIHPLFAAIPERQTNRRLYKNTSIDLPQIDSNEMVTLSFITDEKGKKVAGRAGSASEIVILENDSLHQALFKDVVWSTKAERKKRSGLYIKTMEFNPVQKLLFWLASHPSMIRIARKIKFPRFIAKEDATLYASGGAVGLLSVKETTSEGFLSLGKKLQEVWLTATKEGFAFQPITALFFLKYRLDTYGNDGFLTREHVSIIESAYADVVTTFNLDLEKEKPFMLFRIGYAKPSSGRSSRKKPNVEV